MLLIEKSYDWDNAPELAADIAEALQLAAMTGPTLRVGRIHVQVHWLPDEHAQTHHDAVYEAVQARDGHWPLALTSGVMYRRGIPITRAEFLAVARSAGFPKRGHQAA